MKIAPYPSGARDPTGFSWFTSSTERWVAALKTRLVHLLRIRKISLPPQTPSRVGMATSHAAGRQTPCDAERFIPSVIGFV
jgi:hypothetical protein